MNSTMMIVTIVGSRFLLSLMATLLVVSPVFTQPSEPAPVGSGVKLIRDKLEAALSGEQPASSSISFEDLANAYSESEQFYDMKITVDIVDETKQRRPTIQLTTDLLTAMSSQYKSILSGDDSSSSAAAEAKQEFVKRLEVFYANLRKIYAEKTTYQRPCVASEQADALINGLIGNSGGKAPSRESIEAVKREYAEQVAQFNAIKASDMPGDVANLDSRLNYLNLEETELLVELVFPVLDAPDPIDFEELKNEFNEALEQLNYKRSGREVIDVSKFSIAEEELDLLGIEREKEDPDNSDDLLAPEEEASGNEESESIFSIE